MAKTRDVPQELRNFNKIFEELDRKYSSSQVYGDWLTMVICSFAHKTMEKEYLEIVSRYTKEEINIFVRLTAEMIAVLFPKLQDYSNKNKVWYDFFGNYYQVISYKPGLGQFFTPETVVSFMVKVTDIKGKNKKILDPACGSGRFLIASHSENPKNIHFGKDIDLICCKMTALNMFFHGCKGEVIWGNSLMPNSYNRGWLINPNGLGIYDLPQENSLFYKMDKSSFSKEIEVKPVISKSKRKKNESK